MHALRHQQIAHRAEQDQAVDARIEPGVREEGVREASERRRGQRAARDQHETAVELRPPSAGERQREGRGEGDHVPERNDQRPDRLDVPLPQPEPPHRDRRRHADDRDRESHRQPEPAEPAMEPDVASAHEGGLSGEEGEPAAEERRVDVEDRRPGRRGMQQVLVDREAEAVDHDRGDQQRHGEVERAVPGRRSERTRPQACPALLVSPHPANDLPPSTLARRVSRGFPLSVAHARCSRGRARKAVELPSAVHADRRALAAFGLEPVRGRQRQERQCQSSCGMNHQRRNDTQGLWGRLFTPWRPRAHHEDRAKRSMIIGAPYRCRQYFIVLQVRGAC